MSIRNAFKLALDLYVDELRFEKFSNALGEQKTIVLAIITRAFLDCGKLIKQDDELTKAFEEILEILVKINYEEAAVILDEFRIH